MSDETKIGRIAFGPDRNAKTDSSGDLHDLGVAFDQNKRLLKEIERLSAENRKLERAAYRMFQHIQSQLEEQPGWMQYEFYSPEIDLGLLNELSGALGDKSDMGRWSELMERYSVSTRLPENQAESPEKLCLNHWHDNHVVGSRCPECGEQCPPMGDGGGGCESLLHNSLSEKGRDPYCPRCGKSYSAEIGYCPCAGA